VRDLVDTAALLDATRALVAADSRNPPGNERAAADAARALLEARGAVVTEIEPTPGRVSLVATVGAGDGSRPTLIVNGHLDVVPADPAAWRHDPFGGEVVDGRLYGRGAADMKGGIAAAICALDVVRRSQWKEPACDVVFHLVADEEAGGALGTAVLLERGLVCGDACIDPEPTGLGIGVAERGLLQVEVVIHGVSAHAGDPHRGLSAIEKAAKVVLAVHGADFGEDHPLLGRPSANVGTIEGGVALNVVADRCVIGIDRRLLPGTSQEQAVASIRHRIDAIGDPHLSYDLAVRVFGEASELDLADPFLAFVQQAYVEALGRTGTIMGMQFATDARFVRNQAGIPTVVCGPGELDQAHRVDESVPVANLVDAAALYAHIYATFGPTQGRAGRP
jgi:succinyl-diaminopimelate desuccinylase